MASQGVQLPISLQIENLQEIAAQLKKFSETNILSDSIGGKKINAELSKVLSTLAQIEVKSKSAFKSGGDFTGLDKSISKVELGLEHIQSIIGSLTFKDLKIPDSTATQMAELNARVNELKAGLATFKQAQMDKLSTNGSFLIDLEKAFPKKSAQLLAQDYDTLYQTVKEGMAKINGEVAKQSAKLQASQQQVTENMSGKANFTALGALDWLKEAFKAIPKNGKMTDLQKLLESKYMNMETLADGSKQFTGFKAGGYTGLMTLLQKQFELTPEQMADMEARIREATALVARKAKTTTFETLRKMSSDNNYGAQVLTGQAYDAVKKSSDEYMAQRTSAASEETKLNSLHSQMESMTSVWNTLQGIQDDVAVKSAEVAAALAAPQGELDGLKASIMNVVQSSPELSKAFKDANAQISRLKTVSEVGRQQLTNLDQTLNKLNGVSNFITRYAGIYAIVRRVSTAIRNAFNNIKELDKSITNIAVVTNMSQEDLWGKIGEYTQMAQQYGVATKDVYTVSQIFYQQGLQTNQVMALTTETLKMAKISGMEYGTAANAMTVAIRAFKIEMTDAQQVTDTYSALAAKFAVSSAEIANAMEKTASSAANVGMTLQSTSAFISVMEQTTRESAQNIGSALKSIISRYGEMKASPSKLLEVDGEEVAFNKVDTALKSVGISIKDSAGQFRDFDDVILELSSKWDTLDNNTQRYIATVMAGNRQQSRFIALVSNYDELKRAMQVANDSENASIVQVGKTMDSLETKAQKLKNAFAQIYLDLHVENGLKSMYDSLTQILKTVGKLGMWKGVIPSLLNVLGFGSGLKGIVTGAKGYIQNRKSQVNIDMSKAKAEADAINATLAKKIYKEIELNVTNKGELETLLAQQNAGTGQTPTGTQPASSSVGIIPTVIPMPGASPEKPVTDDQGASGALSGVADAADGAQGPITGLGTTAEGVGGALQGMIGPVTALGAGAESSSTGLTTLGSGSESAATGVQALGPAVQNAADSANAAAAQMQQYAATHLPPLHMAGMTYSQLNGITGGMSGASIGLFPMLPGLMPGNQNPNWREWFPGGQPKGQTGAGGYHVERGSYQAGAREVVGRTEDGKPIYGSYSILPGAIPPGTRDTGKNPEELDENKFSWKNNRWGNGQGFSNARAWASAGAIVAQLAGTAIAAAGAARKDKAGETLGGWSGISGNGVETSKLLTGLGNGLSMGGTGARIGMMFGPWGAAIGGLVGFLGGGLPTIIDGLDQSLKERIALMKEETEAAKEENLKKQAKATDLSTQIDNIKQLQKAMYNSADDMQAYKDAMSAMADQYPSLIGSYDEAGNAIIDMNAAEQALAAARLQGAQAAREAAIKEGNLHTLQREALEDALETVRKTQGHDSEYSGGLDSGTWRNKTGFTIQLDNGQFREFASSSSYMRTYDSGAGYNDVWDYGAAFIAAAPQVLGRAITDVTELTYDDIKSLVTALSENPELGGNNFTTNGYAQGPISVDKWKAYAETYLAQDSKGMTYTKLTALDNIVAEYSDLFGGKTTARQLIDIDNENQPITLDELNEITKKINGLIDENEAVSKSIRNSSNYALAQTGLFSAVKSDTTLSTSDLGRIQGQGIYSRLFNQFFNNYVTKNTDYEDALAWYSDKEAKQSFSDAAQVQADNFLDWYQSLTTVQRELLETTDFTEYSNVDEIVSKFGVTTESNKAVYEAFEKQFVESNKANRERILKAVYQYDENGQRTRELNANLKGLKQFNYDKTYYDGSMRITETRNKAQDIADLIKNNDVISKYADYFTTQIIDINKLAENGYTELASTRLDTLEQLATTLKDIGDSTVQNDLFGTITSIDFSSYKSIIEAYTAIEKYGKENNKQAIVAPLLAELSAAQDKLVFNVNTLASELTTQIETAAKDIDDILSANKSGLTLDKAIESFKKISSAFDEITNFDQVFKYDAVLGKYVYTTDGLQKAIETKEKELATQAEQLSDTAKIYTTKLTKEGSDKAVFRQAQYKTSSVIKDTMASFSSITDNSEVMLKKYESRADLEAELTKQGFDIEEAGIKEILDAQEAAGKFSFAGVRNTYLGMHKNNIYGYASEIMDQVKTFVGADSELIPYYEQLAKGFMDSKDEQYATKTWDVFLTYLEAEAQSNSDKAKDAESLLNEYRANKKNQLYSAVDWNKLATGSDFTGTNQKLIDSLALELNDFSYETTDENGKIIRKYKKGISYTWETVREAYLDQLYGSLDSLDKEIEAAVKAGDKGKETDARNRKAARQAAGAASKGAQNKVRSDQIATAITEILEGGEKVLTDTTIALMNQTSDLNITATDGILDAGQNYVEAALKLYNAHKDNLLSMAEKNNAYTSIITKKFEKNNQLISTLSSGSALDINTLSTTFTTFGLELSKYYNASATNVADIWKSNITTEEGAEIFNPFAEALETDIYGKTRIKDWSKFIAGLSSEIDLDKYIGTFEYQNAYSSYVDGLITLATQSNDLIKKQYDNAFNSVTKFKQLNISQMNEVDSMALATKGAGTIEDGILKITDTIQYARNAIDLFSDFSKLSDSDLYERTGWTATDLAKNWKAARTILTQSYDAWTGISSNIMSLTDDNITTLIEKGGLKISDMSEMFTKVGDNYIISLFDYGEQLIHAISGTEGLTPRQEKKYDDAMVKAREAITNKLTDVNWDKILSGTATEAEWSTFQNSIAESLAAMNLRLEDYYIWNENGNVTLNLNSLRTAVQNLDTELYGEISKQFNESLDKTIASLKQAGLSDLSTAMNYATTGTFDLSAIEEFTRKFKQIGADKQYTGELFEYNQYLNTFTLNEEAYEEYAEAQREYLVSLGMSDDAVTAYLTSQRESLVKGNLNISAFLKEGYLTPKSKNTQELVAQLKFLSDSLEDDNVIEGYLTTLLAGGEDAVKVLKDLKGANNVTAEEITEVYNAATTKLMSSLELMNSQVGDIVDSYTASLFENAGATITDLGNGQYTITSIPYEDWGAKIAAAYMKLYSALSTSAGATLTDLNNAYAKILESAESEQSNPIEAIANATSMTYTQLGEILTKEGLKLEDVIAKQTEYGIESLGAGKIRIKDFTTFAKKMGWDTNTEEYLTAFKTYNDSLIELNRKTEKSVLEEVKGLDDIKAGDKINLTTLWTKIQKGVQEKLESENPDDYLEQAQIEAGGDSSAAQYIAKARADDARRRNRAYSKQLEEELAVYGATFKDGILTINANANIQGIITKISSLAAENTSLLPNELAELTDAIDEYISNLTSLIKNGLSGNLKNTDAQSLQAWADSQDLGKLDFTRTADGLKLSTQSAIELYNALRQIDALQAQLVFDELNSSLKENNENYKSVTSLMGRIKYLDGQIKSLLANRENLNEVDQQATDAKIDQYNQELALAKEILAVRSTAEDDSFNFMSGTIPSAQNNPLNYAKNWTQAFSTIRDAFKVKKKGKTGFIDYEDWYNIANEFNNMAAVTGREIVVGSLHFKGDLTSASNAIQAGAEALTTVDTGELKVNLANVGIGIKSGADALTEGVTKGIQGVASAQVKALDGIIAMLELIVAMEQLGDIDVDGNGIDLSELFTVTGDGADAAKVFNTKYETWRQEMVAQLKLKKGDEGYNEDLQNALKGIKIGEFSMADIVNWDEVRFLDADESVQKAYMAVLSAFSKAAASGNYDLDNIYESVLSVLSEGGLTDTITLDIGDITLFITGGKITQIDWQAADTQEILKLIDSNMDEARKTATELISKYTNNEALNTEELTYVLALQGNVKIENGKITSVTVGGHTYRNEKDFIAAMHGQALEDQGISVSVDEITAAASEDAEAGVIEKTVKVGKRDNIRVKSDKDGVRWYNDDGGLIEGYTSKQAMLDDDWHSFVIDNNLGEEVEQDVDQKNAYLWETWGIRKKITAKVTQGEGKDAVEVQVANDASARASIRNKIQEAATQQFTEESFNSEGNLEITLDNGMTVTLSGDTVIDSNGNINNDKVVSELQKLLGMDSALVDNISTAIGQAFQNTDIGNQLGSAIAEALTSSGIPLDNLTITPGSVSIDGNSIELTVPIETATGTVATLKVMATNVEAEGAITDAKLAAMLENAVVSVTIDKEGAEKDLESVSKKIKEIDGSKPKPTISVTDNASAILSNIIDLLKNIKSKEITVTTTYKEEGTPPATGGGEGGTGATGNIGLASGNAKAQGTLMGELGPELVVSNGRYFVVGQNGPEMVDLADDAIVFNHLQTKSLLEKGTSPGRGRAITNEQNAVSYAKGNINGGPAKASASAALAALKQLRAQWQALEKLTAQDLAGKGGGGGGGGGGDPKAFIKDLERWYNWLQQIAQLEKEITLEQAKREKYQKDMVARGKEYYTSQIATLDKLQDQVVVQKSLNSSQQEYFTKRQQELNTQSAFSSLYGFSDSGQLYYKQGTYKDGKTAFEWLSDLAGRNTTTGEANYTAKEQYDKLVAAGFGFAMEYDSSGNKIDTSKDGWENTALQAFWDKIEADKTEMQTLHDTIEEGEKKVLELQNNQNEILHEIEDNQITVEQKVVKALEESRQREIDEFKKERDAIEKSSKALIDGLNKQIEKEQELYTNQQTADELSKLQRQLAILQRSGGSAAQIADLQNQISEKQKNIYFDTQKQQVEALQNASDAQLERLDHQIELMQETLDYEKENGLLWNRVAEILQGSPESIAKYIQDNTKSYWGQSPTELVKTIREDLFEIERFKQFQETVDGGMQVLIDMYGDEAAEKKKKKEEEERKKKEAEEAKTATSTATTAAQTATVKKVTGKSTGGGAKGTYYEVLGKQFATKEEADQYLKDAKEGKQAKGTGLLGGVVKSLETFVAKTGVPQVATVQEQLDKTTYTDESDTTHTPVYHYKSGKSVKGSPESHTWNSSHKCSKCKHAQPVKEYKVTGTDANGRSITVTYKSKALADNAAKQYKNGKVTPQYALGGMNYATGLAMLHGTSEKPEAVLNAEQTQVLRNNILGNRPDSLVNLLKSYNEAYHGLSQATYDSISDNSNSTIIEKAEVNLQVEQLANDYDSRRAASTIMDEMLRIASKTKANNSVRR